MSQEQPRTLIRSVDAVPYTPTSVWNGTGSHGRKHASSSRHLFARGQLLASFLPLLAAIQLLNIEDVQPHCRQILTEYSTRLQEFGQSRMEHPVRVIIAMERCMKKTCPWGWVDLTVLHWGNIIGRKRIAFLESGLNFIPIERGVSRHQVR